MKKLISGIFFLFLMVVTTYAQSDDYSKWLVRARGVWVSPSVGDNLDGAKVNVSDTFIPELDFTYFFNKNLAAELILGTSKHDVDVHIDGLGDVDLGHVWLLPPTLTLQYHFYLGNFKPYVGAGVNLTLFYGIDEGDVVDMDYDTAFGFGFQAGVDYDINENWFINVDVKRLMLSTDVVVNAGELGKIPAEVDIDPLLFGVGVGYKLGW